MTVEYLGINVSAIQKLIEGMVEKGYTMPFIRLLASLW